MKRISTLVVALMALLALPFSANAEEVTFDFTDPNFRENIGENMNDPRGWIYNETFTVNNVSLQVTAGSAASRIYVDGNRGQNLVTYKDYTTLTFRAPEGKAIQKIEFVAAGNSNINNFTASSGAIEGMIWTGNADGVRFQQGGTTYLAKAIVTLTERATLLGIPYVECENIAAFNALEPGTYAKVTLTDAEVIGKSADGNATVWIQDATGGCWMQYTSLNSRLQEGTKVNGTVYTVLRSTSGNTHMKEAEQTTESVLEATAIDEYTIAEGSLAEVNVAQNLNKLVKISGATLVMTSASAGTLTQGDATIAVNNGTATANQQLHKIAEWKKDSTIANVTIVAILVGKSTTENQLLPISVEQESVSLDGKLVVGKVFYAGSIRLNGATPKNYMKHLYVELYNNSAETINVAGTYIALANSDSGNYAWTATDMAEQHPDSAVVKQIFQIPATGEVLMEPGKSLVVTNCAIDHSEIAEGNVDLSDADFEVKSTNTAFGDHSDAVPALTVVKTFGTTDFMNFLNPGPVGIVLLPADTDIANCPETLRKGATSGNVYTIVPLKNSIDCVDIVKQKTPSAADKRFAAAYDAGFTCTAAEGTFSCQAVARKVLSTEGNGRKVLKDTNNSSDDFETLTTVAPRIYGEGIVTAVAEARTAAADDATVIYNLMGIQQSKLQKGLNIVGNKKIIVK